MGIGGLGIGTLLNKYRLSVISSACGTKWYVVQQFTMEHARDKDLPRFSATDESLEVAIEKVVLMIEGEL